MTVASPVWFQGRHAVPQFFRDEEQKQPAGE